MHADGCWVVDVIEEALFKWGSGTTLPNKHALYALKKCRIGNRGALKGTAAVWMKHICTCR